MKLLCTLLFACYISFLGAQDWKRFKIEENASIAYPHVPKKFRNKSNGQIRYACKDSLANVIYTVMVVDLPEGTDLPSDNYSLDRYYADLVAGIEQEGGQMIGKKNNIMLAKLPGTEYTYKLIREPGSINYIFSRAVLNGRTNYIISFAVRESDKNLFSAERMKFFESFRIKEPAGKYSGRKNSDSAFDAGYFAGQLAFYLILIGGIVWLIIYLVRRSKK